jgi:hypothetical protein
MGSFGFNMGQDSKGIFCTFTSRGPRAQQSISIADFYSILSLQTRSITHVCLLRYVREPAPQQHIIFCENSLWTFHVVWVCMKQSLAYTEIHINNSAYSLCNKPLFIIISNTRCFDQGDNLHLYILYKNF